MRILYFNYLFDTHGASLGSAIKPIELFSAMEKLGHTVKICWLKDSITNPGRNGHQNKVRNILKKHLSRFVHDPKLLFENLRFLNEEKEFVAGFIPDLIVARLDLYLFSALKTARAFGVPLIIEADSPPVYEATEFQKQYYRIAFLPQRIENYLLRNADFVITQSAVLKEYLQKVHSIPDDKIAAISNGADPEKFSLPSKNDELRKTLHLDNSLAIGFIGSMSVWHGLDNLQEIIRSILQQHPQVKFLLVGSGGGFDREIGAFAERNGFSKNVLLTGYVPYEQIPDYVQLMDIVLAPYPNLPFFYYSPVKLFEYMAAGKAVVASKIGQICEIITDGVDGILCEPGNLNEMISAIKFLLDHSREREQIAAKARETILARHTWMHKARQWDEICNKVVEKSIRKIRTAAN
jgi:glycosyltransferase involved in cell wall biosynthesis